MMDTNETNEKIEKLFKLARKLTERNHALIDEKINSNESYKKRMNSYCEEILQHCEPDVVEYLKTKPDTSTLHFGLGLWIRNKYIYKGLMCTSALSADDESDEIIYYLIKYVCGETKE